METSEWHRAFHRHCFYLSLDYHPRGIEVPLRPVDFTYPNIRMNPDGAAFTDFEEGFDFGIWAETDRESVWPDNTILTEEAENGEF